MLDMTSDDNMTSSSPSPSSAAAVSNESIGLPTIAYNNTWTPEVTQRVCTLVLMMIMTLVGNVAVVVRLATRHKSRDRGRRPSRVNIFILNLAIGDLTVCCFTMTTELLFVVFDEGWILGPIACKILLYIQIVTLASTTFILIAMSFDRYWSICQPMGSLPASAQSRSYRMVSVAWIIALIFAAPQLAIFKQVAVGIYPDGVIKYKCASRGYTAWWQRKTYFTFMTSYILVIPAALMTFCYINVALVVWKRSGKVTSQGRASRRDQAPGCVDRKTTTAASRGSSESILSRSPGATSIKMRKLCLAPILIGERKSQHGERRGGTAAGGVGLRISVNDSSLLYRARTRTVQLTLCIVCLFIACWTPYFVLHSIHIWTEYRYKIPERVYVFAETLALVNSAVNPLLYGFFNNRLCRLRGTRRRSSVGRLFSIRSEAMSTTASQRRQAVKEMDRPTASHGSTTVQQRWYCRTQGSRADCNTIADTMNIVYRAESAVGEEVTGPNEHDYYAVFNSRYIYD